MSQFKQITSEEPIKKIIKAAFDTDLPIEGGWGYTQGLATIITANPNTIPLSQFEHMIASMRAYMEMNMTLPKKERYGSINLNETTRNTVKKKEQLFHKVTYEISAMKEDAYTTFIEEYKESYGKEEFDMEKHFQRRKEATLTRIETHWFEVSQVC
jgi:hypothetical protein